MGIFDIFKKSKKEEFAKESSVEELRKNLKGKHSKEKEKLDLVVKQIENIIIKFSSSLDKEIGVLKKIDLEDKREHKKIKLLTMQGLESYIVELERLTKNLRKIKFGGILGGYFEEFNLIMSVFSKNSHKKRERATILIGKEIVAVEDLIKKYFREIDEIFKENKKMNNFFKKYAELENYEKNLEELKKSRKESNEVILKLAMEEKKLIIEREKIDGEYLSFKESGEFKKILEDKKKLKESFEKFKRDILALKSEIDLKELLKKNHSIEKNRILINNYRDNFLGAFEEDKELKLLEVFDSSMKELFGEKLKELSKINSDFNKKQNNLENEKEIKFEKDIEDINRKIEKIKFEIKFEEEKLLKVKEKIRMINKDIENFIENIC